MKCGTLKKLRAAGLTAPEAIVYMVLWDAADCQEDLRIVASREWLMGQTGYSDRIVRSAIGNLIKRSFIKAEKRTNKRAPIYALLHRRYVQPNVQPNIQPENPKNQYEFAECVQPNVQPNIQTGSSAVRRSLGVVHSPGSLTEEDAAHRAASLRGRSGRPVQNPERKHIGYHEGIQHITAAFAKAHGGAKMPFGPAEGNQYEKLCRDRSASAIAALYDRFLAETDPWHVSRGFGFPAFLPRIAALLFLDKTYLRRAAALEKKWFGAVRTAALEAHVAPVAKPKHLAVPTEVEIEPGESIMGLYREKLQKRDAPAMPLEEACK